MQLMVCKVVTFQSAVEHLTFHRYTSVFARLIAVRFKCFEPARATEWFPENTALETRQHVLCLTPKHTGSWQARSNRELLKGFLN